jgi:4-amino-4-deoxy-L-arabinose transferase-like glycosyltransferase
MKLTEGRKYLLFISLLHLVFFILAITVGNIKLPDSIDYIWQAENIESKGSFYAYDFSQPIKIDYYSKRPPFYGLFVWGITSIIPSLYAVLFLQNILSIVSAWLVYKLLKQNFKVAKPALWAALLWVAFPNQLLYANMIMTETVLQFLITAAFYTFVKFLYAPHKSNYIFLNNMVLAVAVLTKPVMLYFWVVNLLFFIVIAVKQRRFFLPLPVLLIPAVMLVWMENNKATTGYRHYSSITHVNLKDYNTKFFLLSKYGEDVADSTISKINAKVATLPTYQQQVEYIKDTTTSIILGDVWGYGKFHAKGMVNFMADPGRFDYVNFFNVPQTESVGLMHYISKGNWAEMKQFLSSQPLWLIVVMVLGIIANGVVLISALGLLAAKHTPLLIKLYLLAFVCYIWFLTGAIGAARFKVPIYPLLIIAAALGWEWLYNYRKKLELGKK